jgi:hypothetical protein
MTVIKAKHDRGLKSDESETKEIEREREREREKRYL